MALDVVGVALRAGSSDEYPLLVGAELLNDLETLLREHAPAHRYALISDASVAALHGERVLAAVRSADPSAALLTFPPGEQHKTRAQWAELSDRMLEKRFGRDTTVIALGGGVTGDLGGFVAATYMRGLPLVQLPSSLLAMVDSSVGGKTGVDTPAGKNLIGAFHPPVLVVADTSLLATLPDVELRAGMAEAVKHGAIADADHFGEIEESRDELIAAHPAALARLVERSVRIKAAVVSRDPFEAGVRKILNFGHTLGHAYEALSGYTLLHGEAIAIGMVLEARLGEMLGITRGGTANRLSALLSRLGLPIAAPAGITPDQVVSATALDKKARHGRVEYSLIHEIGVAAEPCHVDADTVATLLKTAGEGRGAS